MGYLLFHCVDNINDLIYAETSPMGFTFFFFFFEVKIANLCWILFQTRAL